jgi:hypothetical protein
MFVLLIVIKLIMLCVCVCVCVCVCIGCIIKTSLRDVLCTEAAIFFMHTIKSKMNHSILCSKETIR